MLGIVYSVFVFAFGAIVGSFLNVVLLRKNTGESIVFGGSRCFSCGKNLKAQELVPILSFLWQKGRCKNCGSKISWQYLFGELIVGFITLALYSKFLDFKFAIFYFISFSLLYLVAMYDFRTKIIDPVFLYLFGFFALLSGVFRWTGNLFVFSDDLASSFLIALFFYLMWFFSRGTWMGR